MDKDEVQKIIDEAVKKHGLKADDGDEDENGNGDNAEETEDSEESNSESKEGEDKSSNSKVVASLTDSIAEKVAGIVAKKNNFSEGDKSSYNESLRTKIFSNAQGVKEINYPTNLAGLSKDEKIITFWKSLLYANNDPASAQVLRALVEGTDAQGGYLVPEELRTEVFRILPDLSVMRRVARVLPMATDTLKLNTLTARPSAYWTAEYASKSTTSAEFSQVTLSPNDLVCLLPVTDQLIADANINIVQFITQVFAETIAREEDKAFFTGSGSGRPKGINQETLSTVAAGGTIDFDNLLALIDKVPQRITNSNSAAFIGNRNVKRYLRLIKDTGGNYVWREATGPGGGQQTQRLPDTIFGYPFYEQNDLAGSELYFGDWSYYAIGDRQAVSVRTTQEGGEAWRRNATEIKAVERVDGKTVLTKAFAKITGA